MKTYRIKLKSGLTCDLEAENKMALFKKLDSGNYGILLIRGNENEKIERKNIAKIVEI